MKKQAPPLSGDMPSVRQEFTPLTPADGAEWRHTLHRLWAELLLDAWITTQTREEDLRGPE
ncbi:hypothetical protein Sulac_0693 [Sulfobacillus acidophilus DSM 10332]|uniref:Uncharacterized protein n=1 Tax=Sulfobacillus acidophilus (strain ATCC 700253 / DSM 10332 / NAL) TaxID=679936 RepID=G8U0H9_SULAD|nr:hypothetical protein Sulac_0693 [Sulfobacillus acidophilus DSM 10332]